MTGADSSQYKKKLMAVGFIAYPFIVQIVAALSLNSIQDTWYWIIVAPVTESLVLFLAVVFFRAGLHLWKKPIVLASV